MYWIVKRGYQLIFLGHYRQEDSRGNLQNGGGTGPSTFDKDPGLARILTIPLTKWGMTEDQSRQFP
jgi:hypothetical protein